MQAKPRIVGMSASARRWPEIEPIDNEVDDGAEQDATAEPRLSRSGFERFMEELSEVGAIDMSVSAPAVTLEAKVTVGKAACRDGKVILLLDDGGAARIDLDAIESVGARRERSELAGGAVVISAPQGRGSWTIRPGDGSDGERFWWLVTNATGGGQRFSGPTGSASARSEARGDVHPHGVRAAWAGLSDPDRSDGLLAFHRVRRLDAFRAIGPDLACPITSRACEGLMRHLVATGTPLSLRIGAHLGELLETARVSRVGGTAGSLRLATPRVVLRLRGAPQTQAFRVRYPAADATGTLEVVGADGHLAFSARPAVGHDAREWDLACSRLSESGNGRTAGRDD